MKVIKWEYRGGNTFTAQINGGELVRTTEEKDVWNPGGRTGTVPVAVALCFVPDPRIALAGQIAAGLAIVPNSGIISNAGEAVANIAEISLKLADEILRQASKQQITADN